MEINIYNDFLSVQEIEFLTGRKQKSLIIEQLNIMGIPFKQNANGYPIVRRDYNETKSKKQRVASISCNHESDWYPNVLKI
ncbi:Uncharacterised protein [Pasteurella multocida]|uniref:DUF4224 domain-containing protein n=1 Tax=Pasteurella canis TaxID=753 RepID=A0A2X1WRG2_9PAST|nr:DUF4224 domain-containing protein [Pasteurella canis]AKD37390.1 hypothetical protein I926_00300 [Pasteurella multocida subsp. multocida OH4807]VEI57650.1 Uncharacterised protein [Pasteurella multocida]SPY32490.1 Uncharacterised protein [Pasteurella canis]SPY33268.1 Uncharacterised protein [Pasteurella canis]SUC09936.1 Uncharacterised protein [Pasteurella canis]